MVVASHFLHKSVSGVSGRCRSSTITSSITTASPSSALAIALALATRPSCLSSQSFSTATTPACSPTSSRLPSSGSSASPSSTSSSTSSQWKPPPPPPPPPSGSTAAYRKQSRKEWLLVGVAGSAAAVGSWYYWSNIRPRHQANKAAASAFAATSAPFSLTAENSTSFSIPIRQAQAGGPTNKVINTLTNAEVDRRLTENQRTTRVDRPHGACLVARYDTNSVASNDPIEDKRAEVIVERDRAIVDNRTSSSSTSSFVSPTPNTASGTANGDLCFFAVMDGHAGFHTSTLLSQKLIAFVALELDKVFREAGEYGEIAKAKSAMPSKLWRALVGGGSRASSTVGSSTGLDGDPEVVKRAIAKAFRGLDKEIVNTPVELLKEYELSLASTSSSSISPEGGAAGQTRSLSSLAHSIFPSSINATFTATQKSAYESILPALSGSCALLTYIDSARHDVYVACTGDSRAVAGYWDENSGKWEVEALSVDQTGRNPEEVKRMRSEHPANESETVIMRGRVLGGLEPTRAFGDARYKWDRELQGRLYDAFLPGGRSSTRGPPRNLETPPYVTATPAVEWRRVGETSASPNRELRFIIMATDGLWDMMSNEEAVSLVAGHLAGIKGTIRSSELQRHTFQPLDKLHSLPSAASIHTPAASPPLPVPATALSAMSPTESQPATTAGVKPASSDEQMQLAVSKQHPLSKGPDTLRTFQFQDENLSTHLIRNALGGANQQRVAGLLAIPSPESRRYRDDITVNVILFNSPGRAPAQPLVGDEQAGAGVKAKL
ncbi:related to PTC5 - putative 2C protein phosphatase (PP2Cs) [Melanopsichium pennsylvanicum]|uniref:Related to PTC5 - putative 2C protein phosphatase (PP2Cs) n=2 Tax=Melanopsichium pennsylvanicum TaxID=63383 RepID=A0AAJ4XKB2_9BASI|nr:related to PTC5-putative 2C protein phosphatase (PP2Cs) [Melanopsichium pennsylvanicum 4]SNX82673.1 related to PTC5 - putative 2C protein phosphatase (PP2Cs) [Melanopsichium pennsylvanicum]